MGSKYTEAQKKATEEYMKGRKTIRVIVTEEEHKQIQAHAACVGESMSSYIKRLIAEDMQKKKG